MKTFRSMILLAGFLTTGCATGAQTVRDFYPPLIPEATQIHVENASQVLENYELQKNQAPSHSAEDLAQL